MKDLNTVLDVIVEGIRMVDSLPPEIVAKATSIWEDFRKHLISKISSLSN